MRFSCKTSSISLFPSPLGTLLSSGPTSARSWEGGRLNSLFPPFCSFCLVSKATTLKTQTHALALDSRDFTITPDKNNEGPKTKKKMFCDLPNNIFSIPKQCKLRTNAKHKLLIDDKSIPSTEKPKRKLILFC